MAFYGISSIIPAVTNCLIQGLDPSPLFGAVNIVTESRPTRASPTTKITSEVVWTFGYKALAATSLMVPRFCHFADSTPRAQP